MKIEIEKTTVLQKKIGKRIRFLRIKKNWTQVQLGDACGMSKSTISAIERGLANVTIQNLSVIITKLGYVVESFFRTTSFNRMMDHPEIRTVFILPKA